MNVGAGDPLKREFFDNRQVVFHAGDPGACAYVIEEGCVEILRPEGSGVRRLAVLAEGAMFGEVALLDGQPRTATVRALIPTRLIRIDRAHVEELVRRSEPVVQYLLQLLLARFRRALEPVGPSDTAADPPQGAVQAAAVRALSLASELAEAIDKRHLELFHQPLVRLNDGATVGFEALVRWRHPQLGTISPGEFIPLAEKTGLVHRMGRLVLERALEDWKHLRALCAPDGAEAPFVSLNLSAPELGSEDIVSAIGDALSRHGTPAAELHVELTETIVINRVDRVSSALAALRASGVGIALDDFGTGYAGLDYLQSLPFSCLKIDKSFVQQMGESERSFQIVRSALELARVLGMSTIAEGIEDAATAERLRSMGCRYGQGYHIGRPMPVPEVLGWAAARTGAAREA